MKTFTKMVEIETYCDNYNNYESLVYELIFGTDTDYNIHLNEFTHNDIKVSDLIPMLKTVLKKSNIKIISEKFNSEGNDYHWQIKIKRK